MPIGLAIGGAALIGGLTGLVGADMQAGAAKDAANTTANASNYAADLQHQQFEQTFNAMQPWRDAGKTALGQLSADIAPGGRLSMPYVQQPFKFSTTGPDADPSYQFRLSEGLNAMNASAAARGGYFSGETGIDLQRYGQGMASQEYQNQFSRWLAEQGMNYDQWHNYITDTYNREAALAGTGQQAVTSTGQMGAASANAMGNYLTAGALNAGNFNMAGANAMAGAWGNFGNQAMSGVGTYMNYNMMNNFMNKSGYQAPGGGYNAMIAPDNVFGDM